MRGMRRRHAQRRGCPPRMGYPSKANERGLMAHHAYSSTHGTLGACERAAMCRLCPPGQRRVPSALRQQRSECSLSLARRMSYVAYHASFCVTGGWYGLSAATRSEHARVLARGVPRVPRGDTTATTRHRPALPQLDGVVQLVLPIFARPPRRHHLSRRLVLGGHCGLPGGTEGCRVVAYGSLW
jgi:hypothetical protein